MSLPDWARGFASGLCAGIGTTLVGHPFDTVKVRLQANPQQFTGAIQCVANTIKREGILAIYKGVSAPLCTVMTVKSILFSSSTAVKSWLVSHGADPSSSPVIFTAGAAGGITSTLLSCPFEQIKARLQTDYRRRDQAVRSGPIATAARIYSAQGVRGFYEGWTACAIREVPGYGTYFAVYEALKRSMAPSAGTPLPPWQVLLCGGTAGLAFWFAAYPCDLVKTRMQTQDPLNRVYATTRDCYSQILKERGLRGFWDKGFVPALARAFPANAASLLCYELAMRFL